MKSYFLGIDTSNYTTSIAIVDENESLIYEKRKLLEVKIGERGLRQSDALFQHIINMPDLFGDISQYIEAKDIKRISVSSRPRPLEGSYMPVFKAGQSFGKTLANTLHCSYEEFSHQENHIRAALWSVKETLKHGFIAVHISGGTTEILKVNKTDGKGYDIEIIGGTKDISAGQLIDRVGVKMGLSFPAGRELDKLASAEKQNDFRLPVSVEGSWIHFSGVETAILRNIEKGIGHRIMAAAVFRCIDDSLRKTIINACTTTGYKQVLMMGGVASSNFLRNSLKHVLGKEGLEIYFGDAKYCSDNAVGTALLGIE